VDEPPVLLDIGASGDLQSQWRIVAPFSICIAFDADDREFQLTHSNNRGWKKLYSFNRLVAPTPAENINFYLTKSPYCSSTLKPDHLALRQWAFAHLFDVEKVIQLPAIDLGSVLNELGLTRVDWFKCDSQGTDLRIFRSLPNQIMNRVLAADFEPGIISAYIGEDKLFNVLGYMADRPFWVSDMVMHGSQRVSEEILQELSYLHRRSPGWFMKSSPGWCEITYLNNCEGPNFSLRDYFLAWVFASIQHQHGFALQVASRGQSQFNHPAFARLTAFSQSCLRGGYSIFLMKIMKRLVGLGRRRTG
jgi:hypothetical protein